MILYKDLQCKISEILRELGLRKVPQRLGKKQQTYNNVNPLFFYTYIQVHFEDYSKQKYNISLLIPKGKKESDAKLAIKEFLKYYLMSFG